MSVLKVLPHIVHSFQMAGMRYYLILWPLRAESVYAGDWDVLRVEGVDGLGGLAAVKMVKYTAKR